MSGERRLWLAPVMPIVLIAGVCLAWYASSQLFHGPTKDGERLRFYWIDDDVAAAVDNPHEPPVCQICHPWGDVRLAADQGATCERCHAAPHPAHVLVDATPSQPPDPPLPLGYYGEVVCTSCHEAHDLNDAPAGLRLPQEQLCTACHEARTPAAPG